VDTTLSRRAALALPLLLAAPARAADDVPNIAAAADLRLALDAIAAEFRHSTGKQVRISYGSSGNLTGQLLGGAPFQLFLSADEAYVARLASAGRTLDEGQLYAIGRLALVARRGGGLRVDARLRGLRAALAQGRIQHFAIANPEHAPYGQRAREALVSQTLWPALRPRLVLGENVAQALQFVLVGGAEAGIVSLALLRDPAVAPRLDAAVLPATWHRPLRQRMVLMRGAGTTARAFHGFLQTPQARQAFVRHGFTLPGEAG
jgi:molybdate transport system substrate-binding protein